MSSLKQINVIAILDRVSHLLACQGHRGYVVGGFIRDWLLERQTNDIDIAVDGDALNVAEEMAESLGGKFVLLDEANNMARVVVIEEGQRWHLDFSSFYGDIESDLARRDFTINAMAIELKQLVSALSRSPGPLAPAHPEGLKSAKKLARGKLREGEAKQFQLKLIDPFSGKEDLEGKIVRAVSEQIFEADAARLLRAVRLAAELGFTIETKTEGLIHHYAQAITQVHKERTREELLRLLALPQAAKCLGYLDSLGLLLALIPELAESKGVEQPTVHFWDVFDHSLQTVAAVEFLLRESDWEYGNEDMLTAVPWSDATAQHLSQEVSNGSTRESLLKLGGLFHDIAKPKTKSVDDAGRAHFLGHAKQGAAMTATILERLRFSNKEIDLVGSLVYHHLRPAQIANEGLPTQRAIYRYFRDTNDAGIDILFLALADYLASRGPLVNMGEWKGHCQLMNYMLIEHEKQQTKVLPVKLIDGHDLMNTFGLSPGPLVGELLALVREAQADGELTSREEALDLVRREVNKQQCGARSGK